MARMDRQEGPFGGPGAMDSTSASMRARSHRVNVAATTRNHMRRGSKSVTDPCAACDTLMGALQMDGVTLAASTASVVMTPSFRALRPVYYCCLVENLNFADDIELCAFLRLQLKLMKNRTRLGIGSHDADLVQFPLHLRTAAVEGDAIEVFTPLGDALPRPLSELEERWLADPNKKAYVKRAFVADPGKTRKATSSAYAAVCSDADGDTISLYPVSNGEKTASVSTMRQCFLEVSGIAGTEDECECAMFSMIKHLADNSACTLCVFVIQVRCEAPRDYGVDVKVT